MKGTSGSESRDTLLNHVILPRVLPNEKSRRSQELELITHLVETVESLSEWMPSKTSEMFRRLKNVHPETGPSVASVVSKEINQLLPGDTFAMYIRRQNCGLFIHMLPDESLNNANSHNVVVATFPGGLQPSEIYSHDSDIEFNYPVQAVKVKFSPLLRSGEFAQQLCILSEQLPIGAESLDHVSNWLVTVLMDDGSTTASAAEFPVIKKKIRDEIIGEAGKPYFRRSSFYVSIKVMLQHSLIMQRSDGTGQFLYKIAMLKFLIRMYEMYKESNIDLLSQMIAKMARRIEKLEQLKRETPESIASLYETVVGDAKHTIKMIRAKIDRKIQSIQQKDEDAARLPPLIGLNFEADICQKQQKLRQYLIERNQGASASEDQSHGAVNSYRRFFKNEYPKVELVGTIESALERRIFWMDFENVILYSIKLDGSEFSASELREWSFAYTSYAESEFAKNPLLISRMLLVRLKIIAILDKLATKEHPEHPPFKEHRTGVDHKIVDFLLLPHHKDMKVAYDLETYFRQRNEIASRPSLLEENEPSKLSFSVRLARIDPEMIGIRAQILILDEQGVEKKRTEWKNARTEVENLRAKYRSMKCHTLIDFSHPRWCERCSLSRLAESMKLSHYVRLLPDLEDDQFAVVFELRIPETIACLRDCLFKLAQFFQSKPVALSIERNWIEEQPFLPYRKSITNFVVLGSTVQQYSGSSHVDSEFERFISTNIRDCNLHANRNAPAPPVSDDDAKTVLTFKLSGDYDGLQWTLNSTWHTQNQVLSRQSECSQEMMLAEYKNFGSLRADGHRLQLRKLYGMIETEALSFEKESVLMLIMQTIWECGASGDAAAIRESHFDFNEPAFCSAMIGVLAKFIGQQRNNWMHPFKLLVVTLIAMRAFEMNNDGGMANEIVQLLLGIRRIAADWIGKIEAAIIDVSDEENARELRLKIIYVSIAGGLTFHAHPEHRHYEAIFANTDEQTATQYWLHFIVTLKNNILLYENDQNQLPLNLKIFLHSIEATGVYLQQKITELIKSNWSKVHELIKKLWPRANSASTVSGDFHPDFAHILSLNAIIDSEQFVVTTDIITGTFLVNGSPVSRLPLDITQDHIYQWFFGKATLEVQPDGESSFSTVGKYNDCIYGFRKVDKNLIVTERLGNGSEKELIPHGILSDDFPLLLVTNYSHWWNRANNCVEFRQRAFNEKHFASVTEIDYRLDLNVNHLVELKTERPMLDINSHSYEQIVKRLSRLEHFNVIHVLLEKTKKIATVELVRMKLKFKVYCSGDESNQEFHLESNEFNGLRVDCDQKLGTLYGLNHGLVLGNKTLLLIPHGHIRTRCTGAHVSADVDTENGIRNPPFYEYQVDNVCQQLKASDRSHASWFYLAYLHAITSHGEIEPFLCISGNERALQILQSPFAWSSAPYEPDAVDILKEIARLTPIRQFDETKKKIQYIQSVAWPSNIPARSANDSYAFIVKRLIADSERLRDLDSRKLPKVELDIKTNFWLNERDYNRCLHLQPNLRVSNIFIENKVPRTSSLEPFVTSFTTAAQSISVLYHKQRCAVPTELDLKRFLTKELTKELNGTVTASENIKGILLHNTYDEMADIWISLYDSLRKQQLNQEQIVLILTLFAHRKEESSVIMALQAIARNPHPFKLIDPPSVKKFFTPAKLYDEDEIRNILAECYTQPYRKSWTNRQCSEHDSQYENVIDKIAAHITANWPCDSVSIVNSYHFPGIDLADANSKINGRLLGWNNNRKLHVFIGKVTECLRGLTSYEFHLPICSQYATLPLWHKEKYDIDFIGEVHRKLIDFQDEIEEANQIWKMDEADYHSSSLEYWSSIIHKTSYPDNKKHLIEADLLPRSIPSLLLPKLIDDSTDDRMKTLIGTWALAIARQQRKKRIKIYSQRPELKHAMDREMDNKPHINWNPSEYPEWLLFEIEQNLTIRRIQIEIAKRMIEPPTKEGVDAKHCVMQLNMGEGKTAVIVPILAALLANGKQVCQITVLKPLFTRNLKFLRQYLGGLLNRRVYTFPCRRDLPVDGHVGQILSIYEDCKDKKGVILTLPEYRLSFQLKIYDSIRKHTEIETDMGMAKKYLDVHNWINANVRNILDESDAILQPNYQLVYTVGNQLKPDGDELRWLVTQAVLKRIPHQMKKLYQKHGKVKIEFDENYVGNDRADVFTPCRILDASIFSELKTELIDDFLDNRLNISTPGIGGEKQRIRQFLIRKDVDKKLFKVIDALPEHEQNVVMIVCGLLRFEVLKLALTKRWRVNYGVDERGKRRMAIPFKAKDVAAENVEFGHMDAAICFTQLSYYYSGLSDAQLRCLFTFLANEQNPSSTYEKWIESISPKLVDESIKSYSGVNLDDPHQRDNLLFPLLRHNMFVIDHWLSNMVFPHEAKTFESKLVCSAWDLCSERLDHRVTGFSGTNDTRNILPLTVFQNDLAELENTNENMRKVLLQPENQSYVHLPANVSGMQILQLLTKESIPVLLDSGALMLELANKAVAVEWLKIMPEQSFDAAVYFDSADVLQTVDRNGIVTEFDCSVYRENLSRCLVYLDDVHTRGTDLKFPQNWKACVTLCGDITRDKTVQSCMRMRQLGKGHSISFWASYEADARIRNICKLSIEDEVKNEHVVEFVQENSHRFETFNTAHWSAGALNYTKKLMGHKVYDSESSESGSVALQNLYNVCVDVEFVNLISMYGEKQEKLLAEIAYAKFDKLVSNTRYMANKELRSFVYAMKDRVFDKVHELAPDVKQFTSVLDEEQEKELEQEIEEQRQVERPPPQRPAEPTFDKRLQQIVLHGADDDMINGMKATHSLLSITKSLSHTKLFELGENYESGWADHLLVTKDFQRVIESSSKSCDEYLRPIWWIASIKKKSKEQEKLLLLLSSFETDRLLPTFRKSSEATLFPYRPRVSKLHSNLLHEPKLQVGMAEAESFNVHDEVQIGMYAGSMYFRNEVEQNAYCGFIGIIPNPRTEEQQQAVENGMIVRANGFVYSDNRRYNQAILSCVEQCKFEYCPIDFAIKLIAAQHQTLIKESHVASILKDSIKLPIENSASE